MLAKHYEQTGPEAGDSGCNKHSHQSCWVTRAAVRCCGQKTWHPSWWKCFNRWTESTFINIKPKYLILPFQLPDTVTEPKIFFFCCWLTRIVGSKHLQFYLSLCLLVISPGLFFKEYKNYVKKLPNFGAANGVPANVWWSGLVKDCFRLVCLLGLSYFSRCHGLSRYIKKGFNMP